MNGGNFNFRIEEEEKKRYYGVGSFLLEIIKVFVLALIIIVPIRVFLFQPFFVQGASMEPNFDDGDYLIINELGYKKTSVGFNGIHFFTVDSFKNLQRGDVIVFRFPKDPQKYFIKRIVGLPEEKMEIREGKVVIYNKENPSGFILDENSYLPMDLETATELVERIGENEYFVMGDNRPFSSDSRSWGLLDKDKIVGKVLIRAWPMNKAAIY